MKRCICLLLAFMCVLVMAGCSKEAEPLTVPQVDGWKAGAFEQRQLADGVIYMQACYTDHGGLPHVVYILSVDPEKATLYTGTSQNGYELMPREKQTVLEHMQASVADGIQVIAAVNGDFFAISSTYMPSGLCIKDGTQIHDNNSYRPFCAMTHDGQYLIRDGRTDKVDLSTLQTAVGGSHVIVRDGQIHNVGGNDEFSTTSHPRTLSGITRDGKILLVVIDGRQPRHSNGASLVMCARVMLGLGAVEAINHDGGGSSTMILHYNDQYEVVNSPSDGDLRKVYNSVQVITTH